MPCIRGVFRFLPDQRASRTEAGRLGLGNVSRKARTNGDSSARLQASTVRTGGSPGGGSRNTNPGRVTSANVAVVGATPNPAEISHIFVWMSFAYWVGRGTAPALAQTAKKAS